MKMCLRNVLLVLVVLMLAVPVVSAQDAANTVTLLLTSDPPSFDPHGSLGPAGPILLGYIYDTLVYQAEDDTLQPSLAKSWMVSDDGLVITFELLEDVTFSNGEPFNADAVIFTFERLLEVGQRSLIYPEVSNIQEFEKVDDYTVRFHLGVPSASLLSALTYSYASILEPGAVTAAGEEYGSNPVGTGPFLLAEWIPQSVMTMVPNPIYGGHRVVDEAPENNVAQINVRFTRDQSTRVNALLSGEVDIAYITSAPLMEPLNDNADFEVIEIPSRGLIFIGFNAGQPPFDDANVRRAVAAALNKEDIVAVAADGMGLLTDTPLAPGILGYNADLEGEGIGFDMDAAVAYLAEAGYGPDNPLAITLHTLTVPAYQSVAVVAQAQLAELGIAVTVEPLDYGGVLAAMNAGDYQAVVMRYSWNDPDVLRLYLSEETIGGTNRYYYANPAFDELLLQGRQTYDPAARFDIYTEAQRMFMTEVPWIPLYIPVTDVVINSRIQGVDVVHSYVTLENATFAE